MGLFLTISAGKYKGKKVELPSLEVTRSSKAILKGSFFDTMQQDIIDVVFLEAFAGSGSMGLEALSRGAKKAYFFEKDKNSYKILQKNIKNIAPKDGIAMYGDSFVTLPELLRSSTLSNEELIVYIDPPFDYRDGMEDIYKRSFSIVECFDKGNISLVVFEHYSKLELPNVLGEFSLKKTKKFGKSSLSYYIRMEKE